MKDYYIKLSITIINAMNYAPQNSMINITLTSTNHLIIFNIENDGSIAEEDAKHIFDRFINRVTNLVVMV